MEINLCTKSLFPVYMAINEEARNKSFYNRLIYKVFRKDKIVEEIIFSLLPSNNNRRFNNLIVYICPDLDLLTFDERGFVFIFKRKYPIRIIDNKFVIDEEVEQYLNELKKKLEEEEILDK